MRTATSRRLTRSCRVGGVGAADVVFKGAEPDAGGGGEEGLLGYGERGLDLTGDLPGEGVLDVEEAGEFAGVFDGGRRGGGG